MTTAAPSAGLPPVLNFAPRDESRHFDPILQPDLAQLYRIRAARLRELAEGHDLAAYLQLAADVTEAQAACLTDGTPAQTDPSVVAATGNWPQRLDQLITHLRPRAPAPVLTHLDRLSAMDKAALREIARAMVQGDFETVDGALAPFLWAALSSEMAQAVRAAPLPDSQRHETVDCPCCGTAPVASLIHTGERQGLRYLHCALCETEWHMVRAKCSNCGEAGDLDYLSFDTPEAAIRAEACSSCGGYLKLVSLERDAQAEVVADDLASLALDDASVAEGFARTGFNPFALPIPAAEAPAGD